MNKQETKKEEQIWKKIVFKPRSERCLKKMYMEHRFETTKRIKSKFEESDIVVSELSVRRNYHQ